MSTYVFKKGSPIPNTKNLATYTKHMKVSDSIHETYKTE